MTDTTLQIQKGQTTPKEINIKQKTIQTNYISTWGKGEFQRKNSEVNQGKNSLTVEKNNNNYSRILIKSHTNSR